MIPDRFDRDKLYIQLTDIFLDKIRSGEWRTGRQIPTEEELCRSFNVSKITVRRAVNNLALEGYLEKIQGKGTFVREGKPSAGLTMMTTLMESVLTPGDRENVDVIEKEVLQGLDDEVKKRMGPVIERDVFFLSRLKNSEGVPVLVNELYIPVRICPSIREWNPEEGPVFEFLRNNSPYKISRVTQTVEVGRAGEEMGRLLNARPASPCMMVHRLFMTAGDMVLAYSKTTARGDRFSLDSDYVRIS